MHTRLPSRIRGWDILSRVVMRAYKLLGRERQEDQEFKTNQGYLNRSQKTVAKQQKAILRLSSQTSHDAYLCASRGPFPSPTTPTNAIRCAGRAPGPSGTPSGGKPGHREPVSRPALCSSGAVLAIPKALVKTPGILLKTRGLWFTCLPLQ